MGGSESAYEKHIREIYGTTPECYPASHFSHPFLVPAPGLNINVGIDDYLLRYSGTNSNAALNAYSSEVMAELGNKLPDFVDQVGSVLAGVSSVPNAVGIGAFCISMILRICLLSTKDSPDKAPKTEDLLRKVFVEERSRDVRVAVDEYMKRYRQHLNDRPRLIKETDRLEIDLSQKLTGLKDTLKTGHMNDALLKSWINGAAFHAQMLIHLARLKKTDNDDFEKAKSASRIAMVSYRDELSTLLKIYATYKGNELAKAKSPMIIEYFGACCVLEKCCNSNCDVFNFTPTDAMEHIFSGNNQIIQLKQYFPNLIRDLDILAGEEGNFQRPVKQ